MPLINISFRI